MLHKSKSRKINLIKYVFVIPLLAIFLMSFNTEEIYVENEVQQQTDIIEKFTIENDFSDEKFEAFETELKNKGYDFNLKEIERNSDNLITNIYFIISRNGIDGNYRLASGMPLSTIVIEYFKSDNKFIINTSDFIENQIIANEVEGLIKIIIDKKTTANSLEPQKKHLKEKYNVDIDFNVLERNDKGEIKTYTFNIGKGKISQKTTSGSDQPHVFIYDPKTSLLTSYSINKNGDQVYGRENYLEARKSIIITKDYSDKTLEEYKHKLKENGITANFTNVKRNNNGEIIGINISAKSKGGNIVNFNQNTKNPINPISIAYYGNGNGLKIGPSIKKDFHVSTKNNASSKSTSFIVNKLIEKYTGSTFFHNGKEITEEELRGLKNVTILKTTHTSSEGNNGVVEIESNNAILINNQEITKQLSEETSNTKTTTALDYLTTQGMLVEEQNPLILLDGKEASLNDINPDNIHSITVLKDKNATKVFGDKGKNGVILITSKINNNSKVNLSTDDGKLPLIVIDKKEHLNKTLDDLEVDPDDIESINVLKGDSAIKKYGDKAKDGVIEITTKKR